MECDVNDSEANANIIYDELSFNESRNFNQQEIEEFFGINQEELEKIVKDHNMKETTDFKRTAN